MLILIILTRSYSSGNLDLVDPQFKSNKESTRTNSWILDLQKNVNNSQWFYDNLNPEDRKKIRLALDYAIPRQKIIDSVLDGYGFLLATTVVPQSGKYFDTTVDVRSFNQTIAIGLLTEVFGYEFGNDNPDTPYNEALRYFKLTVIEPRYYPWAVYAPRITFSYYTIGIDVVYKRSSLIQSSVLSSSAYMNNYDNQGFDSLITDWSRDRILGDRLFFHSDSLTPYGANYQGVNDSNLDDLIDRYETTRNNSERLEAYYEFQDFFQKNVLKNILFQKAIIYGLDIHMQGFNPYFGSTMQYQNISFNNSQRTLIISRSGEFQHLNPFISTSWYDQYILGTTHYGLLTTSTPTGDTSYTKYQVYPFFVNWWNSSDDQMVWFFNLKQNLTFEDGSVLNTTDVAFSYNAMLNPTANFPMYSTYASQMNTTNQGGIIIHNGTLIEFRLNTWNPFSEIRLFTLPILSDEEMSNIPVEDWITHETNTIRSPVGNGPYKLVSIKSEVGYMVNSSIWTPEYYSKFMNVPFMNYPEISNVSIIREDQVNEALLSLKNGEIDFIDSQTGIESEFNLITGNATYQIYFGNYVQELGLNQASPIWGISPIKPASPLQTGSSGTNSNLSTTYLSYQSGGPLLINPVLLVTWVLVLFAFGAILAKRIIRKRK